MSGGDLHKPNDKAQGLFQVVLRNKSMWMMVYPKGMNNTVKAKIQIYQHFYCYANEVKLELMSICRGQLRVLSWHPSTSSPSFIYKKKTKNLKFLRGMNNFVVNCTWLSQTHYVRNTQTCKLLKLYAYHSNKGWSWYWNVVRYVMII